MKLRLSIANLSMATLLSSSLCMSAGLCSSSAQSTDDLQSSQAPTATQSAGAQVEGGTSASKPTSKPTHKARPKHKGLAEGPRDLNIFQVEPTVIDERYYTSGQDERHQKTSPTLPPGAPIPDNEGPGPWLSLTAPAPAPAANVAQVTKIDSDLKLQLDSAKSHDDVRVRLRVNNTTNEFIKQLKTLKLEVVMVSSRNNEIIVSGRSENIRKLADLEEILQISAY